MNRIDFIVHEASPDEGAIYGTEPTMVEHDVDCGECGETHDIEACPDCGSDIILGFGIGIAPGYGPYKVCERFCGWSWKKAVPNDEC